MFKAKLFKAKSLIPGLLIAVLSGQVGAHADHEHMEPISKEEASEKAGVILQRMATQKKFDPSWNSVAAPKITVRQTPDGKIFVVRYDNPQEKDAAKQKVYITLDDMGNILSANHDGKL